MEATNVLGSMERIGAMLGWVVAAFSIDRFIRDRRTQRAAPHEKRLQNTDEHIARLEDWRRDVERGFTADNNERWADSARRWDTFALYIKDQHALNQATVSAQLVILDHMLEESSDEDLKKAKEGLRAYLLDKETVKTWMG
jgi:hypothetical protein